LDYQYTLKKKRRTGGKNKFFPGMDTSGGAVRHNEKGNDSAYGGCNLYPYMKIEE
jgi:hypothetical protein